MNLPVEIITMLGGTLLGGGLKIFGMMMENKKLQTKLMLERFTASEESIGAARDGPKQGWKGFQWTRRVIALSVVFSVIVLPKLAALLPNPPDVVYAWVENQEGILWGFIPGSSIQHWTVMEGIIITPLDIHTVMAVMGLYFGASVVGNKS